MLDLVFEDHTHSGTWNEAFFMHILEVAFIHLKLTAKHIEIGVQLVTPARSQELNLAYRGKDKPTDVLSFPLEDTTLEKYDILPLGDVFICLDVATRQAGELGIPLDHELSRLTIHGLLHLLGYDHELSDQDADKMLTLENNILAEL